MSDEREATGLGGESVQASAAADATRADTTDVSNAAPNSASNSAPDAETSSTPDAEGSDRAGALLDPGWLFLIAGVAIVSATVLIPAQRDRDEARWYRDRVAAVEEHRQQRLQRYDRYLKALRGGDETLVLSLAATQLNQAPENMEPLIAPSKLAARPASPFAALEPEALVLPARPERLDPESPNLSMLERWATNERSRLWLLAGGALCILIGLLPMSTRRD